MQKTSKLTEQYLENHPSIKDCLKHGLINYSKLSRKISKELKIEKKTSIDAILIACRRFEAKLNSEKIHEDKIINILKKSELEIKNKIVVAIINKNAYIGNFIEIEILSSKPETSIKIIQDYIDSLPFSYEFEPFSYLQLALEDKRKKSGQRKK